MMKNPAFTLIELLITLIIISISVLIAIPAYRHFIAQNHAIMQANQIVTAINYARSTAIKSGKEVTFCKSIDHESCGGEWRDGQIISQDGKVLRIYKELPTNDNLTWASNLSKNDALVLLPTGFTKGQNGSFTYRSGDYVIKIIVEQTGRTRIEEEKIKLSKNANED